MPGEAMVRVGDVELCYETFGDPSGEPLLLVMGLGAQMTAWPVELCEALVDRGFHVIRYDNRDAGRSSKVEGHSAEFLPSFLAAAQGEPADVPYLLRDLAADGAGLLDALGIDSAHVVGASMGGMIAQTIAIEHPERVRTLTSIMSTTGARDVGQPTAEAMQVLMRPPAATREDAIEQAVAARRAIGSPAHFDEELARRQAADAYDRCFYPAGTARQLLAIVASGDRTDALRRLDVPTLVIHGDVDPLVTPTGGQATADAIPGSQHLVLEGMGHDLPAVHLVAIVEAVTALAARHAATAA